VTVGAQDVIVYTVVVEYVNVSVTGADLEVLLGVGLGLLPGQYVVKPVMVSVVTLPRRAGQLVTVAAQDVMV